MDIKQKANEYAQGKVTSALEQMIADAYTAGYTDGYQDRDNEIEVDLPKPDPEFVDLSLPSGTLWAADYLRDEEGNILYLTYNEAKKYNLPTEEQVKELLSLHKDSNRGEPLWLTFLTTEGVRYKITSKGMFQVKDSAEEFDSIHFWVESEITEDNKAKDACFYFYYCSSYGSRWNIISYQYIGYRLPVLVVKKKA